MEPVNSKSRKQRAQLRYSRKLAKIYNEEHDEIIQLAKSKRLNLNQCPTCQNKRIEEAPGQWFWPASTYCLNGQEYNCDCERQADLRAYYLLARIPRHYWTLGFGDFFGDTKARIVTQQYLDSWENWGERYGVGLQFYSPTQGTGKTMLACLIGKELIKRKVKVHFVTFQETLGLFNLRYEEQHYAEQRLRDTPVVILDEVGKPITVAQREYFAVELESLIRFRSDGNAVTIITTNLTPEELDEYYPRTFSLLAAKQEYIHVGGTDARKETDWDEYYKHLSKHNEARPIL